jgi:hypothetical protein
LLSFRVKITKQNNHMLDRKVLKMQSNLSLKIAMVEHPRWQLQAHYPPAHNTNTTSL